MDRTIRKVIGHKLSAENSVVEVGVELVDGTRTTIDVVPEAIGELVLALMKAKTQAAILQDEGMPITPSEDRIVIHHLFPADRMYVVKQPNPAVCHVRLLSPGGALFEFLVPSDQIFQQKTVQQG